MKKGMFLIDHILNHKQNSKHLYFLIQWTHGEPTWEPHQGNNKLGAIDEYLEYMDVKLCLDLPKQSNENARNGYEDEQKLQEEAYAYAEHKAENTYTDNDADKPETTPPITPKNDTDTDSEYVSDTKLEDQSDETQKTPLWIKFAESQPQYATHHVKLCDKGKAKVPDFIGGILPQRDTGNREEYCMTMLTLFKPQRTGKELKQKVRPGTMNLLSICSANDN